MSQTQTHPVSVLNLMNKAQQSQANNHDQPSSYERLPGNLEDLLAAARPRLLRFARGQGVTPDAADDVVQETLLEAWRHVDRLHTPQGLDAWLTSICRNVCLRWARAQGVSAARQTSLFTGAPEGQETETLPELELPDPQEFDPAEALNRQELTSLLDRAMGLLPKSTREALELCYLAELPQREAALRLGVTINTLEVRLHRARQQLRQVLSGELRADAEAFGLVLNQEVALGWRETREWCNLCGRLRLRGLFVPQPNDRVSLRLRCPDCSPRYGDMFNCSIISVAGFHSFHSAYKRSWKAAFAYWMQALAEGHQRCLNCHQQLVPLQIVRPEEIALPAPYPDTYRVIINCPTCGIASTCSAAALLNHPNVTRFIEQHPRWVIGPEAPMEYAGQPAICSSLIDPIGTARLMVVAHRQTLRPLATFSE